MPSPAQPPEDAVRVRLRPAREGAAAPGWTAATRPQPTDAELAAEEDERKWLKSLPRATRALVERVRAGEQFADATLGQQQLAAEAEQPLSDASRDRLIGVLAGRHLPAAALVCAARDVRSSAFDVQHLRERSNLTAHVQHKLGVFCRYSGLDEAALQRLTGPQADERLPLIDRLRETLALDHAGEMTPTGWLQNAWERTLTAGYREPIEIRDRQDAHRKVLHAAVDDAGKVSSAMTGQLCAHLAERVHLALYTRTGGGRRWRKLRRQAARKAAQRLERYPPLITWSGSNESVALTRRQARKVARRARRHRLGLGRVDAAVGRVLRSDPALATSSGAARLVDALAIELDTELRRDVERDAMTA